MSRPGGIDPETARRTLQSLCTLAHFDFNQMGAYYSIGGRCRPCAGWTCQWKRWKNGSSGWRSIS